MNQVKVGWRWNFFARTLEDILTERGLTLTDLGHAGVQREEIRRLRSSLRDPETFPVLNPSTLDRVIMAFQFDTMTIRRVRAALLTTAIERILFHRIAEADALAVTEELYPILLRVMESPSMAVIRPDEDGELASNTDLDSPLDAEFAEVYTAVELGALHLSLSQGGRLARDRIHYAVSAWREFSRALGLIADSPLAASLPDDVHQWQDIATQGKAEAEQRLQTLGQPIPQVL